MSFLIIVALSFFVILSWIRPHISIYLIILLLPSYQIRFNLANIPFTFLEGMILILAGTTLIKIIIFENILPQIRTLTKKISPFTIVLIFAFLFFGLVSIFIAPSLIKASGIFKAFIFEPVIFFFLLAYLLNTENKISGLFKSLIGLLIILSVFGIFQFISLYSLPPSWWAVDIASRRIVSLVNHPNALAHLIGPILALLIGLIFSDERKISKKILYPTILVGLTAFYLTFSRAGWLALIAVSVLLVLYTFRKNIKQNYWPLFIFIGLAVALIFLTPFSREKFLSLLSGTDLSQQNRYVLWSAAIDIILKNPIFGVGLTGFREAYKNYPLGPDQVIQNYPHNFFLNFWLETGFLGLASMLAILISFAKKIKTELKKHPAITIAAGAAMLQVLLHGLVDVPYFKNDLSIIFWTILAIPFLKYET